MGDKITIRAAEARDLDDILRLTAALYKNEYEKYGGDWNLDWVYGKGKKIISDTIIDIDCFMAVAEIEGKVIAFLRASLYWDDWMSWKTGKGAELWDIFIENGFRNQKIGSRLMELFFNWSKQKKVNYILVNVAVQNVEAVKFYRRFKFKNHQIILEKRII
jgi:ribosomal protein S18 acetylase RimI-like enzyme